MFEFPDEGYAAFGPEVDRGYASSSSVRPSGLGSMETSGAAVPAEAVPDELAMASYGVLEMSIGAADLHARVGNLGRALEMYLSLRANAPAGATLQERTALDRRIGYCHERLGQYRQAITCLEPLVAGRSISASSMIPDSLEAERASAHLVLGKCYFETGRLAEAETQGLLASAAAKQLKGPDFGSAENLLGSVAFRRGDFDTAQTHYRRALEAFRVLGDIPALARGYVNVGHLCRRRGEWDRALDHYQAAYYLRATEGDYADQGTIFQHLGLVLLKTGRFEEARERFEAALQRAAELDDRARLLRAHLALAILSREIGDLDAAGEQLRAARNASAEPPAREHCLVQLEEATIALERGDRTAAEALRASAAVDVAKIGTRGDLAIDLSLLEGALSRATGEWEDAERSIDEAITLARADRDRHLEGIALLARARLAAETGRAEEADRVYRALEERFERSGELPLLAQLHDQRGTLAGEFVGDHTAALAAFTHARDLWKRMGAVRRELASDAKIAETLWRLDRRGESKALLLALRERHTQLGFSTQVSDAALDRLSSCISRDLDPDRGAGLEAERALARLEEVLAWDREPLERIRGSLRVLIEALAADGGFVARREEAGLELVGAHAMARLQGRRLLALDELGVGRLDSACVQSPSLPERGATESSALLVPCRLLGRDHVIYLERRSAGLPAFNRSDLNYVGALVAEISRLVPHSLPETGENGDPPDLAKLRHGIYVADVITQDSRMLGILSLVRKVADSDLSVLLQGETGTGKKLVAHALHRMSERRARPFVTVDCAALPDAILESELFGHRRGAFTGALHDRVGLLEEAEGGTIFLDEIDKAGIAVQHRFLHLLDSGEIRPVGATSYRSLDVRVVCATSCPDLRTMVADGRFSQDLYYRLNDIAIELPPLRERPDDVVLLAECFVEKFSLQLGRRLRGANAAFFERLRRHPWPGNVRELEKAIRRAVTLAEDGAWLQPALLPPAVLESSAERGGEETGRFKERVDAFEARLLTEALERLRWNKSRAAHELGLSRKGLKGKIERYGLDRRRVRPPGR